jgi:transposase
MLKKYTVRLTQEQEKGLTELVSRGTANARTIRRAHTLLLAWEGRTDEEIASVMRCCPETVAKTRQRFTDRGMASLRDRPRPGAARKLDGAAEAHLVALACSDPPEGRGAWTMQLLADQLVVLGVVDSVCDETVRRVLKNRRSSRG